VRWQYPSRSDCFECHSDAAGITLGLEAAQLSDAALGSLLDLGYFDRRIGTVAELRGTARAPLVAPFGTAAPADRARSYLHANCAGCHRPGGPGRGDIDLRAETPFAATRLCNTEPNEGRIWDVGVWDEQRIIVPGEPSHSILYLRMNTLGIFRMPPLGTDVVHGEATALMAEWIESISACP
jgi:mono/diheme cytochrome c family protein